MYIVASLFSLSFFLFFFFCFFFTWKTHTHDTIENSQKEEVFIKQKVKAGLNRGIDRRQLTLFNSVPICLKLYDVHRPNLMPR